MNTVRPVSPLETHDWLDGLYAARRMNPSGDAADPRGSHSWHITKRLVDLRYSASATKEHRGKRQELLITTLPPSCVPLDDRFRAHASDTEPNA